MDKLTARSGAGGGTKDAVGFHVSDGYESCYLGHTSPGSLEENRQVALKALVEPNRSAPCKVVERFGQTRSNFKSK